VDDFQQKNLPKMPEKDRIQAANNAQSYMRDLILVEIKRSFLAIPV